MSSKLPVANPTEPFWQSERDSFASHRSTPQLPKHVDIVIVGSGYSGTSVAYNLLDDQEVGYSNVLMLEARLACSGATGRNGGHLRPCSYEDHESYLENFGSVKAAEIVNFEDDHLTAVKEVIEKEAIDCDFFVTRACDTYLEFKPGYHALNDYNSFVKNPYVKKDIKTHTQCHFDEKAREISKIDRTQFCVTYSASSVWPYKFIIHLLKKLVFQGKLNLQTNTPVLSTEKLADGKYLVKTDRGDVICDKLVLATNAYTSAIEPLFENKIVPIKGVVTHIKPDESSATVPPTQLTHTYCLSWDSHEGDYLINRPDNSIIVGGGASNYITPNTAHLFYNNVDDSTLLPDTEEYFTNGYMDRYFSRSSSWFDSKTVNPFLWSGIMGYSNDEFPFVGEIPEFKNKFVLAGYHGHGMPRIWLSGKAIAECLKTGKSIEDVDTKIPRVFMLTKDRLDNDNNPILSNMLGIKYVFEDKSKL